MTENLEYLIAILLSITFGYLIGRHFNNKTKNYGVSKKMYLMLEIQDIDRKIQLAIDVEDYETAIQLRVDMEKLENKLAKIK